MDQKKQCCQSLWSLNLFMSQGPTHRLEITPLPQPEISHSPLRFADLSSEEEEVLHGRINQYERKIDSLMTEVSSLKSEVCPSHLILLRTGSTCSPSPSLIDKCIYLLSVRVCTCLCMCAGGAAEEGAAVGAPVGEAERLPAGHRGTGGGASRGVQGARGHGEGKLPPAPLHGEDVGGDRLHQQV